jgi:RNA polymerase sigma factor (sigma-70 family)
MACARGDRLALQQLYQRESRYLMGVALRIVRQRQQAEDVLHDAFISIWQRAESFNPARGEGRGWVYSVVRNAALNMVRSGARQVQRETKKRPRPSTTRPRWRPMRLVGRSVRAAR